MRIHDLTCARALFAGWVFAYHLKLQIAPEGGLGAVLAGRGYLGVDGFFILSGLVLALAHPETALSWRAAADFWVRRLARLYPVHLAMILLLAALLGGAWAVGVRPNQPERFGVDELIRNLLLVHGWGASDRWAWNYPSWSISTEWAGYLVFPLLWLGARRLPERVLYVALILCFAALLVVNWRAGPVGLNLTYEGALWRFFPEFLAGMLLCRLTRTLPGRTVAGMGAAALAVSVPLGPDTAVVLGLAVLLLGLLQTGRQGGRALLARIPGLVWLGDLSYAFYMSFAPAEMMLAFLGRRTGIEAGAHPVAFVAVSTGLTLVLAVAVRHWVERPAQRVILRRLAVREARG